MARIEAFPNQRLMSWARERAALSVNEAAQKIGTSAERLESWEKGEARPTVAQLRKLAATYKRPLAVFYLPQAPLTFDVMHDFRRTATDHQNPVITPTLALEIRKAHDRREWALELMETLEEVPSEFHVRANMGDDPEIVAAHLRSALQVTVNQQQQWRDEYEAFRGWRSLLEGRGILTFQATGIDIAEARGFSINERPLPAVVANIKDAPRGRIFTLLHEVTHVMLNDGGICDLDDRGPSASVRTRAESFCNRVAGATLFPHHELLGSDAVRQHRSANPVWNDSELQTLSRQFGGSREAALVRLLTLGLTTQNFYERKRAEMIKAYASLQQKGGFAPPHTVALASAGPLFTGLVIENFNRERITASDVADYLQVRLKHLPEIQADFAKQR